MTYAQPLGDMMADVAAKLLGEPNERLSSMGEGVLRFGSKGSVEVNVSEGWFSDYETDTKGGVLELIKHKGGAANDAAAFAWLEAAGIKDKDDPDYRKPSATFYDYRDENGDTLFRVERKQRGKDKTFLQHGPDGRGGFQCARNCMQGVRRVLYRLPELLAAPPSEVVFYCEGEKDADRLAAAGLIATTHPGGAGKFSAVSESIRLHLAGRRVVLLQDNDEAGASHVSIGMDLLRDVASICAPLLLDGLPPKGDVSNWLDAGGTIPVLQQQARAALESQAEAANTLPLRTLDLAALSMIPPQPKAFAVERVAPLAEVTLFTGPGSAGKSLFGQQLATCAAAGLPCLGLQVRTSPALYLTCEDDDAQLHWRQASICTALKVGMASLAGKLHLVSLRGALDNELGTFDSDGAMKPSAAFDRLVTMLNTTGAELAILDNVAHLFAGNENDRGEVTRFVNLLNRLAGATGAAILLVGHPNKSGDDYSGSTAWLNAVRSQITLMHDVETDVRTLAVGKANYAQKGDAIRFMWVEGAFVCERDLTPDIRAQLADVARSNSEDEAFLACLRVRAAQGIERAVGPSPGTNYAPTQFEGMPEAKGFKKAVLKRAMDRLYSGARIRTEVVERPGKSDTKTIITEVF